MPDLRAGGYLRACKGTEFIGNKGTEKSPLFVQIPTTVIVVTDVVTCFKFQIQIVVCFYIVGDLSQEDKDKDSGSDVRDKDF